MDRLTDKPEWRALQAHYQHFKQVRTEHLFENNINRATQYTGRIDAVQIDYSRHHFDKETLNLLFDFAEKSHVSTFIKALFSDNQLNFTEARPVYHQALRFPGTVIESLFGQQIKAQITLGLSRIKAISDAVRSGDFNGINIKHVVNLGVGGSDLGARMVVQALRGFAHAELSIDFVSNLDPDELNGVLSKLDPTCTLVLISSKSFTTYETLSNATLVVDWLGAARVHQQCIAITTNQQKALAFGIAAHHILPLGEWVGGRYSIWSTMGLIVSISIGYEAFESFLQGAYLVDKHMQSTSLQDNIPLTLALIDCWNINFMGALTRAVIPYAVKLSYFIEYLQQLIMESNGKSVDVDGQLITYHTGPIIWGGIGCDSQHAFHQLLMQGTQLVPVDFVSIKHTHQGKDQPQQDRLNHQLLAQSDALLYGNAHKKMSNHRLVRGNVPHTIFTLDSLTPQSLGALLAIYEYRTMLSAYLWRINPFDQFGVELGKELAKNTVEMG
jgi:glucose-6-phosphate isomerase